MRKKSQNRVVVFFINDYQPLHEVDVRYFDELMRNANPKPIHIANCRKDCEHTFRGVNAGSVSSMEMEYKNLRIVVSMTPDFASKIDIVVKSFRDVETN